MRWAKKGAINKARDMLQMIDKIRTIDQSEMLNSLFKQAM